MFCVKGFVHDARNKSEFVIKDKLLRPIYVVRFYIQDRTMNTALKLVLWTDNLDTNFEQRIHYLIFSY